MTRRSSPIGWYPRWFGQAFLHLLVGAFALVSVVPQARAQTNDWWNVQWQYRKKIQFDTTPRGATIEENLDGVTVLLRLHPGNFDFTNAKQDGEDLRFVSSDGQTFLSHHIEKYDPIDEIAFVWVKIPRLSGGSNQDFIWLYYGNPDAIGGQDGPGSYDPNQVGVYHLSETEAPPKDQTAFANNASDFMVGQGFPSVIGNGVAFNGAGDRIIIPASPSLDFSGGFTYSTWLRISGPVQDAYLFAREEDEGKRALVIGIDETKVHCRIETGKDQSLVTEKTTDLSLDTWHHLAVTASPGERLSIYLDGIQMDWIQLPKELSLPPGDIVLGASKKEDHFFAGDLDEVQISNVARSLGWIRVAHACQGPDGALISFGEGEAGGGGGIPVFYLRTIVKNISLDGWAIIGMLMLIGALSWLVFLSKAFFLWMMARENRDFLTSFDTINHPLELEQKGDAFQNSPLFRIYHAGCQTLKGSVGNPQGSPDSPIPRKTVPQRVINAFRATLERAFIDESRRLNSWLIVLTMAITGGPFLGLLGTVWGVMNTFAAMAEIGEANLMAIAPGVASALSTTVVGLLVAIPALFTYNYLASRVRNMTAEMTVFLDQLALKAEEVQGGP